MKKLLLSVFCILLVTGISFGRSQFRLAGDASIDFVSKPSLTEIRQSFDTTANMMTGIHWQVILNSKVGFGQHYLVRFSRIDMKEGSAIYDWWFDFNGDAFLRY